MKNFIVGIDPGKNGGIVSLTNGRVTTIDPMPATLDGLWDHFLYLGFPNMIKKEETHVYMEHVHSRPTDSRVGAFSFGRHHGHLDFLFNRMGIKVNLVTPQVWMGSFNIKRTKEESQYDYKKRLLEFTLNRVHKQGWTKRLQNNLSLKTCDAYLIALYGYNQLKSKNKE